MRPKNYTFGALYPALSPKAMNPRFERFHWEALTGFG